MISTPQSDNWRSWFNRGFKRLVDVLVSVLGLALLAPFFLVIAALLRREGPGLVFYRGPRLGYGGKPFGILKFRTMRECPESYDGPRVTAKDDERITPLGHWLRDTKLNELPQLWNVLTGEMSLVGPRPEDPEIAATWPDEARREILSVRPGITSPASVLYHDEETMLSSEDLMATYMQSIVPDKLRLDRLYVRNHSFLSDLDILLWTAVALLPRLAGERIPEGSLFAGPLYRMMRRYVSWFFIDLAVSLVAVTAAGFLWRMLEPINWGIGHLAWLAFALALLFSTVNSLVGLKSVIWSRATAQDGLVLGATNSFTICSVLFLNRIWPLQGWLPLPPLAPELIILIGVFSLFGFIAARYRLRLVTSIASRWLAWRQADTGFGERVLILGAGQGGEIAAWLLRRGSLKRTFKVVGMVDDDPAKQGMRVNGCWILGSSGDLPDLIRKHDVGVLLCAISNLHESAREAILHVCHRSGVRPVFLNNILGVIQDQLAPADR